MEDTRKRNIKAVLSPNLSSFYDKRYVIIDTDTGEILDDAQGYGYRSARNAHAGYAYKTRDTSKDAERHEKAMKVHAWLKENSRLRHLLDDELYYRLKDRDDSPITTADMRKFLSDYCEEKGVECPFPPRTVLSGWQKYDDIEKEERRKKPERKRDKTHKQGSVSNGGGLKPVKNWLRKHKDLQAAFRAKEADLGREMLPNEIEQATIEKELALPCEKGHFLRAWNSLRNGQDGANKLSSSAPPSPSEKSVEE